MKKVITTPDVDIALSTLGPERLRQVQAWFGHLANWDSDSFIRENSHELPGEPGVFVLRTTSDWRIFFSLDGDVITIIDLATKQAILRTFASPQENR